MPRKKRPPFEMPPDGPEHEGYIPTPATLKVEGPTAQELAAHGSEFMTQALLVKAKADHPDTPPLAEVMPTMRSRPERL